MSSTSINDTGEVRVAIQATPDWTIQDTHHRIDGRTLYNWRHHATIHYLIAYHATDHRVSSALHGTICISPQGQRIRLWIDERLQSDWIAPSHSQVLKCTRSIIAIALWWSRRLGVPMRMCYGWPHRDHGGIQLALGI